MRNKKAKTVLAVYYTNESGVDSVDRFRFRDAAEAFAAEHGATVVDETPSREWTTVVETSFSVSL